MATKAERESATKAEALNTPLAELQDAGFGSLMGMSAAWMETLTEMSAEMMSFMAERIKEDVKTQHEILHCKNMNDLQQVQAKFIEKAVEQYQAETGKLVKLGSTAFSTKTHDTPV